MLIPTLVALAVPITSLPPGSPPPMSDQVGVYALIDRVVFHPNKTAPERVEVFGAFAIAQAPQGNYYRSPRWGFLAFHLDPKAVDKCRAQWNDLASVAGKGKCIGFGFRYYQKNVRVWQAGERKQVKTSQFQTGMGIRPIRNANYGPVRQLRCLPRPLSPASGSTVECRDGRRPEQVVKLTVKNCLASGEDIRYVFEIERAGGDIRGSAPIPAGDATTSWKVGVVLTPGETVKWRVRVIGARQRVAAVAQASFRAVAKPAEQPVKRQSEIRR